MCRVDLFPKNTNLGPSEDEAGHRRGRAGTREQKRTGRKVGASVLTFVKDVCGIDSMHLNTQQCHPVHVTAQLSKSDRQLEVFFFSLFFSYLTER